MTDHDRFDDLEEFLEARGDDLLRAAVLLAGSREAGEDLLQEALVRLLRHWHKIEGGPEGYLRRTLYNLATDRWRYRSRRPEVLVAQPPELEADGSRGPNLPSQLIEALAMLPSRQRAVLVLRYFADASDAETATVLGCPIGTVKSDASRGLSRLRELTQNAGTEEISETLPESLLD